MKKILRIVTLFIGLLFDSQNNVAAQNKSECFDVDYVVRLMPGISRVDTLLAVYQQDSLDQQYQALMKQIQIHDSLMTVRGDVIGFKSNKDEEATYSMCMYLLQNWLQYSQQALLAKWQELTRPYQIKVINAFQTVVTEEKYNIGCRDTAFWKSLSAVNLHVQVIRKLGLKVPDELLQQDKPLKSTLPVRRTR